MKNIQFQPRNELNTSSNCHPQYFPIMSVINCHSKYNNHVQFTIKILMHSKTFNIPKSRNINKKILIFVKFKSHQRTRKKIKNSHQKIIQLKFPKGQSDTHNKSG